MEKTTFCYFTVELVLTEKEYRSFNSSVYDIVYHEKPKNKYFFKSEDNAMKHINGFLQSRPSKENWVEQKPNDTVIKHFCYEHSDKYKYDVYVVKHDVVFNDSMSQEDTAKEDEMELVARWFEHIAQIAEDRKTANGDVMEDWAAMDEIRALATDSAYYVRKHLQA